MDDSSSATAGVGEPEHVATMLAEERSELGLGDRQETWALCLSGGGIRSATFSLGVLQGLARARPGQLQLPDFHYLSTVSGGGYVGSWLSRWRCDDAKFEWERLAESGGNGGGAQVEPIHPVRRLRSFSNYMAPSLGVSVESLTVLTILVRNFLFNQLIWIPLVLALAILPYAIIALFVAFWDLPLAGGWPALTTARIVFWPLGIAAVVWALVSLQVLFASQEKTRERMSRRAGRVALFGLAWAALFGVMIYLPGWIDTVVRPEVAEFLKKKLGARSGAPLALSASGGLFTIVVGLVGFWSRNGSQIRRETRGVFDKLGSRLFNLVGALAVLCILVAGAFAAHYLLRRLLSWVTRDDERVDTVKVGGLDAWLWLDTGWKYLIVAGAMVALLAFAYGFSRLVRTNRFSLHGLYGNRLTRAYLGTARRERAPDRSTDFDPDDDVPMSALKESQFDLHRQRPVLFHVINMTLNLTRRSVDKRDWQERKAASFTATPLHCGSAACSGYASTAKYGGPPGKNGEPGGLTLGRAMTISGAAASPNMGYHSAPFVTMVLTFLNVRLGWWMPKPDASESLAAQDEPTSRLTILKEALSAADNRSDWLYLSDGGHFDNLGLYEMVRRRCRRIVVVDGTCDGEYRHADLLNAVRKVHVDFGIRIDLPPTLPGQPGPGEKQRVVVGRIRYEANVPDRDGQLFYVKPLLTGDEPPALTHYAQVSRRGRHTFPHHSTLDQFFNETQFESYRLLGEVSAVQLREAFRKADAPDAPAYVTGSDLEPSVAEVRAAYPLLSSETPLTSRIENGEPRTATLPIEANPPPAAQGAWQTVIHGVQAMGTAKLVASTVATVGLVGAGLTVGGQVGIRAGQVIGLEPVKIDMPAVKLDLSEEASEQLDKGLVIDVTPLDLQSLDTVTRRLERVAEALGKLTQSHDGTTTTAPVGDLLLAQEIRRLARTVDAWHRSPNIRHVVERGPDLGPRLDALAQSVNSGRVTKEQLDQLTSSLRTLAAEVRAASRRNAGAR